MVELLVGETGEIRENNFTKPQLSTHIFQMALRYPVS
jgi:hypothetical protein